MTCPNCHKILIPYIYEDYGSHLAQMQNLGLIMIGMGIEYQPGFPTYYCKYCQENHYFISADVTKKAAKKSYAKKQAS